MVDAYRNGSVIASDLAITSGSVTDDSASPGVRRTVSLELFPTLDLWDLLEPIGTEVRPRMVTRYPSGVTETVPMGVFDIDGQSMSYGTGGTIRLSGSDKWGRIQRARFIKPQPSWPGVTVSAMIAALIRGALGASEPVNVLTTSEATVGSVVWERDRDKAIEELAKSIGAYVSFDRTGVAEIRDMPTIGPTAVWTVDAGTSGVLLSAQRDRDRKRTYNVVIASSDKADGGAPFDPVIVWDSDPGSATYAGPDPLNSPELAGPFGVVPYFYTSPLLTTAVQAEEAAYTILHRVTGRASQVGLSALPMHALDSLDVIDVLLPSERRQAVIVGSTGGDGFGTQPFGTSAFGVGTGIPTWSYESVNAPLERHIIDRIVHPIYVKEPQQLDTRSTRTDEFT